MKILITGAAGFTARHLHRHLARQPDTGFILTDVRAAEGLDVEVCDLSQADDCRRLLAATKPDRIYHLAGTFTNDYAKDYVANVRTTLNLLDGVLELELGSRVLLIGSAAEYGLVQPEDNPIPESFPLRPIGGYGLTKVIQTQIAGYYQRACEVAVMVARTFNLVGQGISPRLFAGRVMEQIDRLQRGEIDRIKLGNLESVRDYVDVAAAVEYYELIMERGAPGEVYNVGSGIGTPTGELLKQLLADAGLDLSCVETPQAAAPNPRDVPAIFADISKLLALKND